MSYQSSFYTFIKISSYNPDELLKYKNSSNGKLPRYDKIKVILPDWVLPELKVSIDPTGKIKFSEIKNEAPSSADFILDIAKKASLEDKYVCKIEGEYETQLASIIYLESSKKIQPITIVSSNNKEETASKALMFITDTLLNLYCYENEDNSNSDETEKTNNCINHIFFWINNSASKNLQREVLINLNAKTHFIREYGNWFTREVIKAAYMYVEYTEKFEAIEVPLDYSIKKLNEALFELEERKKSGTIIFDSYEVKGYYRFIQYQWIKGVLIRINKFMNSDFPLCFVFKMRNITEEELKKELEIAKNYKENQVIIPENLKAYF